jgi:hypothetical protein
MHVAGMLLGCLLFGSTTDAHGLRSSDIVAQAMQLPAGCAIGGQPLTLAAALGSTSDRGQQLMIVRAYWRLVRAAAEYSFCRDYVKALDRIKPGGQADAVLRPAMAAATAQLHEIELGAVRAQYELAELMRLPPSSPLPMAADRPLVIAYGTKFNEMFAGRTPPDLARLSDRILPIQRQAIDDRAAAVQAADDALVAVADDYQSGRGDAASVIACGREVLRQQRAFIETVCAYNRNIADYALLVVSPGTSPQGLKTILIGDPSQMGGSSVSAAEQAVRATSGNEPISTNPMRQPGRNEPTLAPPRPKNEPTLAPPPSKAQPTFVPPNEGWKTNERKSTAIPDSLKPVGKDEPQLTPPPRGATADPPRVLEAPVVPVDSLPVPATPRTARKPVVRPPASMGDLGGTTATATATSIAPLYPALVAAMPAGRAKQLATALYWDRLLPKDAGKPISLADCLLRDGNGDHRPTIEAYWLVRQRAAQYQLLAQQTELLDAIAPTALERHNQPSGAADMLRLHAAQLAIQAAMRESHVALVEAQYVLALRIGALAEAAWPLASTVPHSGGYVPKVEEQPASLRESWPVRRLAAMMPGLGQGVQERAAAVVDADAARVAVAGKYAAGTATIEQVIDGITEQTEQTWAFLEAMAAYNRAIAEYATTVLPPGTPVGKLVAALVTKP